VRHKTEWALLGGLVALRLGMLIFMLGRLPDEPSGHWLANDAVRYMAIAATPGAPYLDHEVEVPPVELFLLEILPSGSSAGMAEAVGWTQIACDIVIVVALSLGWDRRAGIAYLLVSMPLVPFVYFRLDLLSVALAVSGMALIARRASVTGGAILGVAVMAKLWPVVLAPALFAKRSWSALIAWTAVTVAAMVAWIGWTGAEGPRQVTSFRGASGWQIESGVGAILLRFSRLPIVWEGDANRVGTAAWPTRVGLGLLLLAGLAVLAFLGRRRTADSTGVVGLAGVALLLLLAPIMSWQYLIWLTPWAALAWIEGDREATWVALACVALTTPLVYLGVELTERQVAATTILLGRNLALISLVVVCFVTLAGRSRISGDWETDRDESQPTGV